MKYTISIFLTLLLTAGLNKAPGQIEMEIIPHGDTTFIEYFDDSTINSIATKKNGKLDGPYVAYYRNGMVKKIGSFHEGLEDGNFMYLRENGHLMVQMIYSQGQIEAPIYYWNEHGIRRHVEKDELRTLMKENHQDSFSVLFTKEEIGTIWRIDTFGCLGLRKAISVDTFVLGSSSGDVRTLLGNPADSSGSSLSGAGNWIYIISTDYCEQREREGSSVWEYGGLILELRIHDGIVIKSYRSIIN